MPDLVITVMASVFRALRSRRDLVLENLALRHQLAVLNRTTKHKTTKHKRSSSDRFFWAAACGRGLQLAVIVLTVVPGGPDRAHR